jgi:hypothetical protein
MNTIAVDWAYTKDLTTFDGKELRVEDRETLLEADLPANPASPKNVRLANALEKDMQKYFKTLSSMMPDFSEIYYKYVEQE